VRLRSSHAPTVSSVRHSEESPAAVPHLLGTSLSVGFLLLAVGALIRLVYLNADPTYDLFAGYVTDEGRWTELAREMVLFGSPDVDSGFSRMHLVLAPAYQAVTWAFFAVFGVGFVSARLVSATAGIGLLVAAFLFLRSRLFRGAFFFTILALAIQPDLVFFSRIAIPEMTAMLFEFLAFSLLISEPRSLRRAVMAGLVTAVGLSFKATIMPIVPIFAAVAVVIHRTGDPSSGWRRSGAYLAGVVAPLLAALLLIMVFAGSRVGPLLVDVGGSVVSVLAPRDWFSALTALHGTSYAVSVNTFLLGVWSIAGLLAAAGRLPNLKARAVYLGSGAWIVGWWSVSMGLAYFPERYVIHVLVPLALNVGAGLTLLQHLGLESLLRALDRLGRRRRILASLWFALPMAILLGGVMMAAADLLGIDVVRVRERLAPVLAMELVLASVLLARWNAITLVFRVVAPPLIVMLLWLLGRLIGAFDWEFWTTSGAVDLTKWIVVWAMALGITAVVQAALGRADQTRKSALAGLAALATVWLSVTLLGFSSRTYVVAEAASALEEMVDDSTVVGTVSGASVFLGTRIRYIERLKADDPPNVLLEAFGHMRPPLEEQYRLAREFQFPLGEHHAYSSDATLRIYQRIR
jgi:hypothetical protein